MRSILQASIGHCLLSQVQRTLLSTLIVAQLFAAPAPANELEGLPRPPCQTAAPFPAYPTDAELQNVSTWEVTDSAPRWTPPACTGWASSDDHGYRTMVALTGRIELPPGHGTNELLHRLGSVSTLKEARYWSVTDHAWKSLVTDISALSSADPLQKRADFSPTELEAKQDVFFVQHDNRTTNGVVYRMRVRERLPNRLVVEMENVTGMRLLLATLFQPKTLQTVHFFERIAPNSWGYYSLTRTTEAGSSSVVDGHAASYVNRAAAYYRFLAGIPTDREPPLAPQP